MAGKHYFLAGEGALWAQPNGPNTEPIYLGCHQLGDIDRPRGDSEPVWCQDESGPNRFKIVATVQGAPGLVTTTVTTKMSDELDELERAQFAFTLFVTMSKAGRKDIFANFDRVFVLGGTRITNEGIAGVVVANPDDNAAAEMTFDISAESLLRLADFDVQRNMNLSETSHITDIAALGEARPRTDESVAVKATDIVYASTSAPTGSPSAAANVIYTENGGTFTAMASDPFAAAQSIAGIEVFYTGRSTRRVLVARGTADGAAAAEVAYTDNNGVTWTQVDVGVVNGQYAPTRFSLFSLNRTIWMATQDGYVYKSADGGGTWVRQQAGTITAGAINCVRFVDRNVGWFAGANNIVARSLDGGNSWGAVSGPSAQAGVAINVVEPLDRNRVWLGYADGSVWFSNDAGVNWEERTTFNGSGTGTIQDIRFVTEELGLLARNDTVPEGFVSWSPDGGYTWMETATPDNSGINVLAPVSEWDFYIGGQANAALGFIALASA